MRKKSLILVVMAGVIAIGGGIGSGCAQSADRKVGYYITGTASKVSLTVTDGWGSTIQRTGANVPISVTFECNSGQFVYCSAQNEGAQGSVTATIKIDGKDFKTATSQGAYVIATVSGSVP